MARRLYWFGKLDNSYDASAFFAENREYDALFAELQTHSRFMLLSLRPQLCRNERCAIYEERTMTPVFKDSDHFNPQWLANHGEIFAPLSTR